MDPSPKVNAPVQRLWKSAAGAGSRKGLPMTTLPPEARPAEAQALPQFIECRPINGYLSHAVRAERASLHCSMPNVVVTYTRALCGVGRGGMRVALNDELQPRAWKGIDGCDRCHVAVRKIREAAA